MNGTRIRTISSHQLAKRLLNWTENGRRFMCREANNHLGVGGKYVICKLLEEFYPGQVYNFSKHYKMCDWKEGEADPITCIDPDGDSNYAGRKKGMQLRQEFCSKLLRRPDRQLCWLCLSEEEGL